MIDFSHQVLLKLEFSCKLLKEGINEMQRGCVFDTVCIFVL